MLYLLITIAAGAGMTSLAIWSLVRAFRNGGVFITQIRFLISGILLAFQVPVTDVFTRWPYPLFEKLVHLDSNYSIAWWLSLMTLVAVQIIVLPTRRELYGDYLSSRLGVGVGSN